MMPRPLFSVSMIARIVVTSIWPLRFGIEVMIFVNTIFMKGFVKTKELMTGNGYLSSGNTVTCPSRRQEWLPIRMYGS